MFYAYEMYHPSPWPFAFSIDFDIFIACFDIFLFISIACFSLIYFQSLSTLPISWWRLQIQNFRPYENLTDECLHSLCLSLSWEQLTQWLTFNRDGIHSTPTSFGSARCIVLGHNYQQLRNSNNAGVIIFGDYSFSYFSVLSVITLLSTYKILAVLKAEKRII